MSLISKENESIDIPNKNIVIHGSCITRDIFRIHPEGFNIIDYFARSCLSSVITPPIDVTGEDFFGLTSDFQKRMVVNDFRKSLFQKLETLNFDYFLIDFIDERFNLLQAGATYVTKSAELMNSKYLNTSTINFKEIPRLKYPFDSWKSDCEIYISKLTKIVAPEKIIIIKGMWAEKYLSISGETYDFNGIKNFRIEYIKKMNVLLDNYYDFICYQLPLSTCISYPQAIAQENHQWGLSPFHYLTEQYDKIYEDICAFAHAKCSSFPN